MLVEEGGCGTDGDEDVGVAAVEVAVLAVDGGSACFHGVGLSPDEAGDRVVEEVVELVGEVSRKVIGFEEDVGDGMVLMPVGTSARVQL